MNHSQLHSVSVAGAVINNDQRVLAIKRRDNGHWELPGGVLERNETLHDGVRREIHEETGISVEPQEVTGVYQNMPRGIIAFVFRCRPLSTQVRPTVEASEVAWLTPTEIADRMDEAYAIRLLDAVAPPPQDGPMIRSHDGVRLLTT